MTAISSGGIIFEILSDTIIRKLFMYLPVLLLMYKEKTTMYATERKWWDPGEIGETSTI